MKRLLIILNSILIVLVVFNCSKKQTTPAPETSFKIEVKDYDEFHFIYYEFTGPYQNAFNDFGKFMAYLEKNKIEKGPYAVGLYFDDPSTVAPEKCRSEIGWMVTKEVKAGDGYKYKKVGKIKGVTTIYKDYAQIPKAYAAIAEYIQKNNLTFSGQPAMEIMMGKDEKEINNEIVMPVK